MKSLQLKQLLTLFSFLIVVNTLLAQNDSVLSKKRLALVVGTETVLYGTSIWALNELWYKDYPKSSFHFFNDNAEWMQMDKVGHITTSYYVGKIGINLLKWSGVKRKKAIWFGGMLGTVYLSTIEMLDGYSSQWGFSNGDFLANIGGSVILIGQELFWNEQRIVFKFSYSKSGFAEYRPQLLGGNFHESILKDYNGQTYWLSINPASFLQKNSKFPKWLNVAIGYGADGMLGGMYNPIVFDNHGNQVTFDRYRQFYLSLDVDLTRIKTKSKVINTVFNTFGFLKIPCPTLEFNRYGVKGHLLGY